MFRRFQMPTAPRQDLCSCTVLLHLRFSDLSGKRNGKEKTDVVVDFYVFTLLEGQVEKC